MGMSSTPREASASLIHGACVSDTGRTMLPDPMTDPTAPIPPTPRPVPRGESAPLRFPNSLLSLGSAAVLSIYSAGYLRTQAAADQFAREAEAHQRPARRQGASPTDLPVGAGAPISGAPTPLAPTPAAPSVSSGAATGPAAGAAGGERAKATGATATAVASTALTSTASASASASASPATPSTGTSASSAATTTATGTSAPAEAPPTPPTSTTTPTAVAPTPATAPPPAHPAWQDGTYTGWGTSRHGDIEATVTIENGRITGAAISRCLTRYSCSWIAHLQRQVVDRQSPEVDYVSGATQSTNAFYYAVVEALLKAKP